MGVPVDTAEGTPGVMVTADASGQQFEV